MLWRALERLSEEAKCFSERPDELSLSLPRCIQKKACTNWPTLLAKVREGSGRQLPLDAQLVLGALQKRRAYLESEQKKYRDWSLEAVVLTSGRKS